MNHPLTAFAAVILLGGCATAGPRPAAAPAVAPASSSPARSRAEEIRLLLQVSGSAELSTQVMRQMLPALKKMLPTAPASFWDEFMRRAEASDLADMIVPIYEKHLSAEDVRGLIAFYQSPLGRRLVAAQPAIVQESMAAGQAYGAKLATDIVREARARGLQVRPPD